MSSLAVAEAANLRRTPGSIGRRLQVFPGHPVGNKCQRKGREEPRIPGARVRITVKGKGFACNVSNRILLPILGAARLHAGHPLVSCPFGAAMFCAGVCCAIRAITLFGFRWQSCVLKYSFASLLWLFHSDFILSG